MPSKTAPGGKRAALPRASDFTKAFVKDWQRLSRAGRHDLGRLKQAMLLLIANDGPLPPEWLDHPFKGSWSAFRECHIGGDFLLIYQVLGAKTDIVVFNRAGTHAELFE
ncbi:MAG TPA: type II toxin-antitoxin system YafQ family toxin [Caulobacteraceae bacterium]